MNKPDDGRPKYLVVNADEVNIHFSFRQVIFVIIFMEGSNDDAAWDERYIAEG